MKLLNNSLWHNLIDPWIVIIDPEQKQRLQVVAGFAFIIPIFFIGITVFSVYRGSMEAYAPGRTLAITLVAALVPYFAARLGRATLAVGFQLLLGTTFIFVTGSMIANTHKAAHLGYLCGVGLYALTFLRFRWAAAFIGAYLAAIWLILPVVYQVPAADFASDALLFNGITAFSSMLLFIYWRQRQREQQRAISESQSRYRIISEMTSDYMFFVRKLPNDQYSIEWITEPVDVLSGGYRAEDFSTINSTALHPDDVPRAVEDRQRVLNGETHTAEYRLIRRDDSVGWIELKRKPAFDERSQVIGYYGSVRDITEEKAAIERQMQLKLRREQFSLVGQLVGAISHDFRNRLSTIESSRYLIERMAGPELGERLKPRMETIQDSMQRMIEQIDNLSIVATLNEPHQATLDVEASLEGLCSHLRAKADRYDIRLCLEANTPLPPLEIDPQQFESAVQHLLVNAITYSPRGQAVVVHASAHADYLTVEVRDHGPGIAQEEIPRIFEAFYKVGHARTVTHSGVGLGLTITKLIMEALGGRVEVESVVGEGSTFRLCFPLQTK